MRSTAIAALFALSVLPLLPAAAAAQTGPQEGSTSPAAQRPGAKHPAAPGAGGVTRDQYVERAKDRAGQRAAARFDQMDANHDGILDPAEIRSWRSQHSRHAKPLPGQAPAQ